MTLVSLFLAQLAAFAALALAAAAAGMYATRRLPVRDGVERLAVTMATGLGVCGTGMFFVALGGWLNRWSVFLLTAAALGGFALALFVARSGKPGTDAASDLGGRFAPDTRYAVAAIAAALVPAFVWTLYPPTAYDATVYHLPFARAFVEAGRLVATPELVFEIFPQFAETLFAATMAASGSDLAPALVQLLAVAATALLVLAAGRRFLSPRAGLWAAALWLAHPLVHYQAASAYVDATMALFCLFAVVAWELWRAAEKPGWLALAGAAAGWAAGTKYLGLIWLALLALLTFVDGPRAPFARRLRATVLFVAMACLAAAPWYLRIWATTGNPFHPFLEKGGATETSAPRTPAAEALQVAKNTGPGELPRAIAQRLLDVVRRPAELARFAWRAAFEPRAFDRQAPLAPWNLALVPLAALFAIRDRQLRRWLLIQLGYAVFWTTSQTRFQLPGAALLALAGAGALERLATALPAIDRAFARRGVAALLGLALVAPGPLYTVYKIARFDAAPPTAPAARTAFLEREVAGFAGIDWLEKQRSSAYTVYLLGAPNLTYYASGRVRGQNRGPWRVRRVVPLLSDAIALHRELRAMEVDYLLVTGGYRPLLRKGADFDRLFERVEGDARHDLYELAR